MVNRYYRSSRVCDTGERITSHDLPLRLLSRATLPLQPFNTENSPPSQGVDVGVNCAAVFEFHFSEPSLVSLALEFVNSRPIVGKDADPEDEATRQIREARPPLKTAPRQLRNCGAEKKECQKDLYAPENDISPHRTSSTRDYGRLATRTEKSGRR